ncbi:hypothetical protein KAU11_10235 [Candidatus Babeliales bacterium]|nr:hypothetical protein [Candidatus Babeliales bacterium]
MLKEQDRAQLDAIVGRMEQDNVPERDIQTYVDGFKKDTEAGYGATGAGGFVKGLGKGLAGAVTGTAELLQKGGERIMAAPQLLPGGKTYGETLEQVHEQYGVPALKRETPEGAGLQDWLKPRGTAETAGKFVADVGTLVVPGTQVTKGAKVAETAAQLGRSGLFGKIAGGLARRGTEAAGTAGIVAAQEGEIGPEAAVGGAFGFLLPGGGKATQFLSRSKPEVTKGLDDIYKAVKPRLTKGRALPQIKSKMETANKIIVSAGHTPKNFGEYAQSLRDTKKVIWDRVQTSLDVGKREGLQIDLGLIADKIRKLAQNPALKRIAPDDVKRIEGMADTLVSGGKKIDLPEGETIKQFINEELSGTFGKMTTSNLEQQAKKILTKEIGIQENAILGGISGKGEFGKLKQAYGALKEIEPDVLKREIVFSRQNPISLIEGIGAVHGVGNIIGGVMSPAVGVGQTLSGIGQMFAGWTAKRANDADLLVAKGFNAIKKAYDAAQKEAAKKAAPKQLKLPKYDREKNEAILRASLLRGMLGTD